LIKVRLLLYDQRGVSATITRAFASFLKDCYLPITSRYCRWWEILYSSAGTAAWLFDKVKY